MQPGADRKPVILITGSAGLIGSRLLEAFSNEFSVVGLDLKAGKKIAPGAEFIECDLTDDQSVKGALSTVRGKFGGTLASVIHLASHYDFSGEPSPLYKDLTVEGTRRLLRELHEFDVEQFVFSSTLLVMEPALEDEVITETSPLEDEPWDYPRSKMETERLISEERGKIPAVILRIAGVYNEDGHTVPIAQQMTRIYEKQFESIFFPGDASRGQAFVHLEDLVDCFRSVVERRDKLQGYQVFLIGEPDVMSYAELQDQLGELIHGREWPTIRIPKAAAKLGAWLKEKISGEEETFIKPWMIELADDHYPIAVNRARETLGWNPKHSLRDTLAQMVSRLKQNPRRWYEQNKMPLPDDQKEDDRKEKEAGAR